MIERTDSATKVKPVVEVQAGSDSAMKGAASWPERENQLLNRVNHLAEEVGGLGNILSQLAALFRAAGNEKVRQDELLALGHYVADDWANLADTIRGDTMSWLKEFDTPQKPQRKAA